MAKQGSGSDVMGQSEMAKSGSNHFLNSLYALKPRGQIGLHFCVSSD